MPDIRFPDLEIRIFKREEQGYPVEIQLEGRQQFRRGYLSSDTLPWISSGDLGTDGQRLFELLFADTTLRSAWERALGQFPQRRIRLWIDADAPELHTIPWELLQENGVLLAAQPETPFSRYLPCEIPYGEIVTERPIRILIAISNPHDLDRYQLAPLDVEQERHILKEALGELPYIELDFIPSSITLKQLETHLHKGYHVLHYIGHGAYNHRQREAMLYLQDEAGNTQVVTSDKLCELLKRQFHRPHLVYLSACQSATRDTADAFRGLGPQLITAGIPTVVAMQDSVSIVTARELSQVFYTRLLEHGTVDLALNQARGTLVTQNHPDFAIPVLFMRLKDGQIFAPQTTLYHNVPFMVDDLPSNFVPRPVEYNALRNALLERDTSVAITAALRGAGGFGKTTLACALCHELRSEFPDGVLWVTLGETPDVIGGALKLYDALTGERPAFVDIEDAAQKLAEALGEKHCLLVIDDVWNATHLPPFFRGGKNCVRLLTTRNRDALPIGVRSVNVDAMHPDEAVALLGAGIVPTKSHSKPLQSLAAILGEWPLLISLVNGALRTCIEWGQSPDNALAWVNRTLDKHGLTAFDAREPKAREQAVALTIEMSLNLLDTNERTRYLELAIFPEDVDVPLDALVTLWNATGGLDTIDSIHLCLLLADRSLLRHFDLDKGILRLHDVLRAYLVEQHENFPALHAQFIIAYAALCTLDTRGAVQWATGPDDDYFFQYLPYHLVQAGQDADLYALLLDPDWLRAKLQITTINDLIADYNLALTASISKDNSKKRILSLIQGALKLSSHVLARDKTQLPGQLIGRLLLFKDRSIRILIAQVQNSNAYPWLCPITPSLEPSGSPLICTLKGHKDKVITVAVTPDGQWAVSGSQDKTLKVWDLMTGAEIVTLIGHTDKINAVAIMSSGQRVVSGSQDGTLKIWNLTTGMEEQTLSGQKVGSITAVIVTPDEQHVVSGSKNGTLKVWNLMTGEEIQTLIGHTDAINAIAMMPDGQRVLSASEDKTIKEWNLMTGLEERTLGTHSSSVSAIAVMPDGCYAISASVLGDFKIWNLLTGKMIRMPGHTSLVSAVVVTSSRQQMVSASWDKTIKVWDLTTGKAECTLFGHTDKVTAMTVTPDKRYIVSASLDKTLKVWSLMRGEKCRSHEHTSSCDVKSFEPEGETEILESRYKMFKTWDLEMRRAELVLQNEYEMVDVFDFYVTRDGQVFQYDSRYKRNVQENAKTINDHNTALAIMPDGKRAVVASYDETIEIWDLATSRKIQTLGEHGYVSDVAVTPDGQYAVSVGLHGIILWNLETGMEEWALSGHNDWINKVIVLPDGQRIVTVSDDHSLKVWDLKDGELIATFTGDNPILSCAIVLVDESSWERWCIVAQERSGHVHILKLIDPKVTLFSPPL
ncbi:MAG: CHAT domain-containing protein [Anaerolineae bacterium]|nr:CHAT domain-containing protein [Anaerolineae bacterium]